MGGAPRDLLTWAREFLPEYFSDEPSAFHIELMRDLANRSKRLIARVAPRGHAKSTCASLALPLWAVCERQYRNILIVSHEATLATQFVRDIRMELESNDRIVEQYGDQCAPLPGEGDAKPRRRKWSEANFTTSSGVTILAKGGGAALRGVRSGPNRPDLIICDDIECDAQVQSSERRDKLDQWLRRVLMPTLAPGGRVIVIGSLLHFDSLLSNLRDRTKFPGWDYRVYRALEAEAVVAEGAPMTIGATAFRHVALWPARWSVERLLEEQERIGTLAFQQEYQANPIDTGRQVFRSEWLKRYDPSVLTTCERLSTFVTVDPAVGKTAGDFFAIWIGSVDRATGKIYTRELSLEKIDFVAQVRRIIAIFETWRPEKIGIEANAYQMSLVHTLREYSTRNGLYMPIEAIITRGEKKARIQSIAPVLECGDFLFPPDLSRDAELQFLEFPNAKHDDGPDVCAMGIELARGVIKAGEIECRTARRDGVVFGPGGI
ncbi:MAG: hypothetical protein ACKVS9_06830 [Phycisphaerae bacterium]